VKLFKLILAMRNEPRRRRELPASDDEIPLTVIQLVIAKLTPTVRHGPPCQTMDAVARNGELAVAVQEANVTEALLAYAAIFDTVVFIKAAQAIP
jgi:hypothetical protein